MKENVEYQKERIKLQFVIQKFTGLICFDRPYIKLQTLPLKYMKKNIYEIQISSFFPVIKRSIVHIYTE